MTASLARFLPDFEVPGIKVLHASRSHHVAPEAKPEPEIDIAAIRAQARAEGEAAARAEMSQQHELDLQAAQNRHAEELATVKAELEMLAAQTIPEAIAARSADIAGLIAGDVEAVLAPLIDDAIRTRIIAGLADEIRTILELDNATRISVSGPEGVIQALRQIIGPDADRLVVGEADGVDVEIEVDRTRFVSRISEWTKVLVENPA
ncbi:hypothetical protein IMCC20628_03457 [Hoeflea sp. IMCC20628]|uniref:hypothetical protein n=1 Tax=Hoeflea sp. IMCC20628 TaxID=1620421 RepID=UPI00063BD2EC|nr:hypothetical protein [Hoeflea sp. IMCC20628]AKI02146.1 hypothetical protein IMCC20628_03457 [Hoeflea sp. IMCC20628]